MDLVDDKVSNETPLFDKSKVPTTPLFTFFWDPLKAASSFQPTNQGERWEAQTPNHSYGTLEPLLITV
jgi:hypothetical protein